ncbi:MAG: ribosomal protein S18-alanine N-acetyltransferase [Clostridia bacterium]|nr:ribosomal protein S18-alanine N-acetyltransferase [Clostridia bacterium]
MEGFVIRPMEKRDIDRVHEIECACFRSPWSKLSLLGELKNDIAKYYVLEADGRVEGYGGMWVLFEEAHVTNIAVMAEHRRKGYATEIILALMRGALFRGASEMTLEVRENNFGAQALYKRMGFEQNGYRPKYYSDTGEGALLLWNRKIAETVAEYEKKC